MHKLVQITVKIVKQNTNNIFTYFIQEFVRGSEYSFPYVLWVKTLN